MIGMGNVDGHYSGRLRKLFGAKDHIWTPPRPADSKVKRGKVPDGVQGVQLGGRKKK